MTLEKERQNKGWNNLKPAKKGEPSRNPTGRRRKTDCLLSCIKDELGKKSLNGVETKEQVIAGVLVQMAERGNIKAIELIMSYTTPKPPTAVKLGNEEGKPFLIKEVEVRLSGTNGAS